MLMVIPDKGEPGPIQVIRRPRWTTYFDGLGDGNAPPVSVQKMSIAPSASIPTTPYSDSYNNDCQGIFTYDINRDGVCEVNRPAFWPWFMTPEAQQYHSTYSQPPGKKLLRFLGGILGAAATCAVGAGAGALVGVLRGGKARQDAIGGAIGTLVYGMMVPAVTGTHQSLLAYPLALLGVPLGVAAMALYKRRSGDADHATANRRRRRRSRRRMRRNSSAQDKFHHPYGKGDPQGFETRLERAYWGGAVRPPEYYQWRSGLLHKPHAPWEQIAQERHQYPHKMVGEQYVRDADRLAHGYPHPVYRDRWWPRYVSADEQARWWRERFPPQPSTKRPWWKV